MADASPATNAQWFARAARVIPGGVDSPVRSFASVGGTPYTVVRGEGASVFDVEGHRYIDLVQSYGAVLLGHAHPGVTDAITRAAALGTTFGAPTPGEVERPERRATRGYRVPNGWMGRTGAPSAPGGLGRSWYEEVALKS